MNNKNLLMQRIEKERKYCDSLEVGCEAYEKSFNRLSKLQNELAEMEKVEAENERRAQEASDTKKDRKAKNAIEVAKFVSTGIVMPALGFVVVTAFEKDHTFTSALKDVVKCFIPKKVN